MMENGWKGWTDHGTGSWVGRGGVTGMFANVFFPVQPAVTYKLLNYVSYCFMIFFSVDLFVLELYL